jgi:hypothetical protein
MKRALLLVALLALPGCGHIMRSITGEGTPHCKPKCSKAAECQWKWVECSGPFVGPGGCSHSDEAACRDKATSEWLR